MRIRVEGGTTSPRVITANVGMPGPKGEPGTAGGIQTLNGKTGASVTLTAADVGAIQTINSKSGASITLTAADVNALPLAGGTLTGELIATATATLSNLRVGAYSGATFAGGTGGLIAFPNATTPPTGAPSGAVLYVQSGQLKVRQADQRTVTLGTNVYVQSTAPSSPATGDVWLW